MWKVSKDFWRSGSTLSTVELPGKWVRLVDSPFLCKMQCSLLDPRFKRHWLSQLIVHTKRPMCICQCNVKMQILNTACCDPACFYCSWLKTSIVMRQPLLLAWTCQYFTWEIPNSEEIPHCLPSFPQNWRTATEATWPWGLALIRYWLNLPVTLFLLLENQLWIRPWFKFHFAMKSWHCLWQMMLSASVPSSPVQWQLPTWLRVMVIILTT